MLPSMSLARWFLRCALLSAGLLVGAGRQVALAAEGSVAADSGWFDPQALSASPVTPLPPAASPTPQPGDGAPLPSLPPSPLLEDSAESTPSPADTEDRDSRALSDFRPALDPYGTWVQHSRYGTVWVPRADVVGSGFAPYFSSGRWALDEDSNWVWVSDYPFGNVVFHYGRWVWVEGTGWAWVPGYRYAPAWVHWRVPTGSYAYVGWAPMGPDYVWYNGYAVSFLYGFSTPWVFCPSSYIFYPQVHRHVVRDRRLVTRLAANTRRYVPAHVAVAAAQRERFTASPSLSVARVPAGAVPAQRLRAQPTFSPATRIQPFSRGERSRFEAPRADAVPGSRARVEPPRRIEPRELTPSAVRPERSRFVPAPSAPSPRGFVPAPSPSPRGFVPAPSPSPRGFVPAPSAPRSRAFQPDYQRPRFVEPRSRTVQPRSFSPAPRGGGGGGFRPSLPRGRH